MCGCQLTFPVSFILSLQRKWSEFVGGFTVLKPGLDGGWKQPLQQRLSLNLRFYKANYAFIAAILSVWFMTWSLMFAALFMGAAYGFLFYVRRAPFIVGGVLVTQRQQLLAWRIGTWCFMGHRLWLALTAVSADVP